MAFGEGEHPVAFGPLLETAPQDIAAPNTAALEPVDDEQILTSSRPATLGDPIFWRNDSPEAEARTGAAEQPEEPSSGPEMRVWKQGKNPRPVPTTPFYCNPSNHLNSFVTSKTRASPSVVDSESILLDPAAQAPLTVDPDKAGDLAANPIEWMATAPPEHSSEASEATPGWDEPIPDATDTIDRVESLDHAPDLAPVSGKAEVSTPVPVPVLTQPDAAIPDKTPSRRSLSQPQVLASATRNRFRNRKSRQVLLRKRHGYGALDSQTGLGRSNCKPSVRRK